MNVRWSLLGSSLRSAIIFKKGVALCYVRGKERERGREGSVVDVPELTAERAAA